ncbi:1-aminocyclopropane-1-carboxylate synthase 7 [Sarracenia purpurea var. burkii]
MRRRTSMKIIHVHCDSSNKFQLTLQALESADANAKSMNVNVRGLLITKPSNPLGATIPCSVLKELVDFIARKNIHLVSDEIYSGSVFSPSEFVSVAEILAAQNHRDSERIHIVYSLSKDLGLPGFRIGGEELSGGEASGEGGEGGSAAKGEESEELWRRSRRKHGWANERGG